MYILIMWLPFQLYICCLKTWIAVHLHCHRPLRVKRAMNLCHWTSPYLPRRWRRIFRTTLLTQLTLILTVSHSLVLRALQVIVSCTCTVLGASTPPPLTPPLRGTVSAAGPSFSTLTPSVSSFAPSLPGPISPSATDSGMRCQLYRVMLFPVILALWWHFRNPLVGLIMLNFYGLCLVHCSRI